MRPASLQPPAFRLTNSLALVTGASRGIGQAIALALAEAGARVIATGRDGDALAETARLIEAAGGTCHSRRLDVADLGAIDREFVAIGAEIGPIDILVNNAGIEEVRASIDVDEALWDRIVDTNLKGAFFCARSAARGMSSGGGCILNVCSLTSEVGVPTAAPYGASKAGLVGITRALAAEWAPLGIRVNGLGPGYFRTALTEAFYQNEAWQARMLDKIPLRRFGQLEDLIGAAVFLCSPAASYITGQILYVDGGTLAAL